MPAATRGGEAFRRFLIVHVLAYLPVFVWGMALVPAIILSNVDTLNSDPDLGDHELKDFMLRRLMVPAAIVFILGHLVGVRWIAARDKRGRLLALGGLGAFALSGIVYGAIMWTSLLKR